MPTRKSKARSEKPASTAASRVAILLEDIQGKVQATMEAVSGLRNELRSEIEALRVELSRRLDVLDLAVRQNSADIRQIRAEIREMREEMRRMREVLERKADHEALLKLQARVEVLERRLGIQ